MMDLRRLQYFVALAEELHFGRAAERVFVAQSTLSGQIRRLEEELGARLFERTRRSVALTEPGRALLPRARRLLRDAERAEATVRRKGNEVTGTLRIAYQSTGDLWRVVPTFRERAPAVRLELSEATVPEQEEALRAGRADVGFVYLPIDERGLRTARLRDWPVLAAVPDGHRLAGRDAVALRELAGEPHVLWPRAVAPNVHDEYVRACHEAGFSLDIAQEVAHTEGVLGLVAAGVGVAPVHASAAGRGAPGVSFVPITDPDLRLRTGVAWRGGDEAPALSLFLRVVRESAGSLGDPIQTV